MTRITSMEEVFFLESGKVDIKTEIKIRRTLYFQNLMKRNKKSLVLSFLQIKILYPDKGETDILQVQNDIRDFSLPEDPKYYENVKAECLKETVKEKSKLFALNSPG